jgi:cation transport regulator ChaB
MPWPTISDLPKTFNTLPAPAKTIALAAGNAALERLGHAPTPAEEADIVKRVMWGAVKAKFKQGPSGKWVPIAEALEYDELGEAVWSTAKVNELPDSAFLYIHPDYKSGKNKNKALRKLPYREATGKIDPAHLRNAAARLPQTTDIPAEERTRIASKIRRLLDELSEGVGFTDDELLCERRRPYSRGLKPLSITRQSTSAASRGAYAISPEGTITLRMSRIPRSAARN